MLQKINAFHAVNTWSPFGTPKESWDEIQNISVESRESGESIKGRIDRNGKKENQRTFWWVLNRHERTGDLGSWRLVPTKKMMCAINACDEHANKFI
jgi:hypothetical protein